MNKKIIEVLKPGLLTTVQDLGRYGYQQYGMVVSGAMDQFALQVGNLLVGNKRDEAGIEITLLGPELLFLEDALIALCGADLSPSVDGDPAPLWKAMYVTRGQVLQFGQPKTGARTYLTVAGGFNLPLVMGSKSTYTQANLGGHLGRALRKGDLLFSSKDREDNKRRVRGLASGERPHYFQQREVRVILGPDQDAFSTAGLDTFMSSCYTLTNQSDRMGYRLTGERIEHKQSADIISDATTFGTIQVPANGEPIILMADRQTTGGYTRIATIISVDLPIVAQLKPGDRLTFRAISVKEAQQLYREEELFFKKISFATRNYG